MTDPLETRAGTDGMIRLPVLGVRTRFASEDGDAIAAIREAYGSWSRYAHLAGPPDGEEPVVRIEVRPRADAPEPGPGPEHRLPEATRLVVAAPGIAGEADAARGTSHAVIAGDVLRDRERFVHEVLDPLTLFLLGRRDRQPVHAAGIVRSGTALLLAGPSGTGKSTLTYAASRHGFSVLADEPVYVQLRPQLRVWGRRPRVHLPPDARMLFPELAAVEPRRLPTGKTKLVLDLDDGPRCADRAVLCLLTRQPGGSAGIEAVDPESAIRTLTARLDPGFDLFADSIGERIARVAAGGAWVVRLTDDPRDALPLLDDIAATAGRGS